MRPAGAARLTILALLQGGTVGSFDAIASAAALPEQQAINTLKNLRREGLVRPVGRDTRHRRRVVYAPAAACEPFDALADAASHLRTVWR